MIADLIYKNLQQQNLNHIKSNLNLLDLGCGSGYLTAFFVEMMKVQSNGNNLIKGRKNVVAVEAVEELVELTKYNLETAGIKLGHLDDDDNDEANLAKDNVNVEVVKAFDADGSWNGDWANKMYDVIHVSFAIDEVTLGKLMKMMNDGGFIVGPLKHGDSEQSQGSQELSLVRRGKGKELVTIEKIATVMCQEMKNNMVTSDDLLSVKEMLQKVEAELKLWTDGFIARNGRRPTKADIDANTTANNLFIEFQKLRKRTWT